MRLRRRDFKGILKDLDSDGDGKLSSRELEERLNALALATIAKNATAPPGTLRGAFIDRAEIAYGAYVVIGADTEPWLSGCQVLSGDLSGCRAAVRHCQVPLSDQLSGAVSAVGCCRVRV